MAIPKSVCDNCVNTECIWRAPTGGNDPPVMICPHKIDKPQTNADRIRAMTNEELAVICEDGCPPKHECPTMDILGEVVEKSACQRCWLDWLKQEVE